MEDVPRLPDEHLAKAKEIILEHRKKKSCNHCYGRGFRGVDQNNMAVLCHKCVDEKAVMTAWQAYVRDTPALAEAYGDYFEEDEEEVAAESEHPAAEHARPGAGHTRSKDGPHISAGAQHHRPGNR